MLYLKHFLKTLLREHTLNLFKNTLYYHQILKFIIAFVIIKRTAETANNDVLWLVF